MPENGVIFSAGPKLVRKLWQYAFTIHYNMKRVKNAFKSDTVIANQGPKCEY